MLFVVASTLCATAQDVIFLGTNDSIVAKVISVGTAEIIYRRWNNLEGPTYSISIADVVSIRYANGIYDYYSQNVTTVQSELNEDMSNSGLLYRSGNTYYSKDMVMNKKETLRWLETQSCQEAYWQFHKGYITSNVGWGLFATGSVLGILGGALYRNKIYEDEYGNYRGYVTPEGPALIAIGSIVLFASVPTIAVGYSKMHKAVHVYNVSCGTTAQVKSYWSLQVSNNGFGVAYNF